MKTNSIALGLVACLLMILSLVPAASAQADLSTFEGSFTLTQQVQWNQTVLPAGNYTVIIGSSAMPMKVLVRDGKGRAVACFVGMIDNGRTGTRNELRIEAKGGRPHVYAFALASVGRTLVYDRGLERKAFMEASASQTVPVMLAKR